MKKDTPPYLDYCASPLGTMEIRADDIGIRTLVFLDEGAVRETVRPHAHTEQCARELGEYFGGRRAVFTVPLHPVGTEFQKKVWRELSLLPFGKTVTYLDISNNLGDAGLSRAVGSANGKNPIWVILPCHRVIGSNGALTGYAGGIHRKKWLLLHEAALPQGGLFQTF